MKNASTKAHLIGTAVLLLISIINNPLHAQCSNSIDVHGILTGSIGVPNANRGDGAPDGVFTGNISGNSDDLFLSYQSDSDIVLDATLCVAVAFNDEDGHVQFIIDESYFSLNTMIQNPINDDDRTPQEICIPVKISDELRVQVKHQFTGQGNMRFDGSILSYCSCDDVVMTVILMK